MKYVLSQKEYSALISKQTAHTTKLKEQLIKFANIVIDECELPCIHQPQHSRLNIEYCDNCPLQDVCPMRQEYSQ